MRASELIKELKMLFQKYGDLDVVYNNEEMGEYVEIDSLEPDDIDWFGESKVISIK